MAGQKRVRGLASLSRSLLFATLLTWRPVAGTSSFVACVSDAGSPAYYDSASKVFEVTGGNPFFTITLETDSSAGTLRIGFGSDTTLSSVSNFILSMGMDIDTSGSVTSLDLGVSSPPHSVAPVSLPAALITTLNSGCQHSIVWHENTNKAAACMDGNEADTDTWTQAAAVTAVYVVAENMNANITFTSASQFTSDPPDPNCGTTVSATVDPNATDGPNATADPGVTDDTTQLDVTEVITTMFIMTSEDASNLMATTFTPCTDPFRDLCEPFPIWRDYDTNSSFVSRRTCSHVTYSCAPGYHLADGTDGELFSQCLLGNVTWYPEIVNCVVDEDWEAQQGGGDTAEEAGGAETIGSLFNIIILSVVAFLVVVDCPTYLDNFAYAMKNIRSYIEWHQDRQERKERERQAAYEAKMRDASTQVDVIELWRIFRVVRNLRKLRRNNRALRYLRDSWA